MNTNVTHKYEDKFFPNGQIKQCVLKLARLFDMSLSDVSIYINYNGDEFDTRSKVTIDGLENINEIGTLIESLSFHFKYNIILLSISSYTKNFSVTYIIEGDIEYTKKFIFIVENALELIRLRKPDTGKLTNGNSKVTPDTSCANKSEDVIENSNPIGQIQMDSDHFNILNSSSSDNSVVSVWQKASKQLQLLLSSEKYQTWIASIVPSADGNQLILNCPDEFSGNWIESRYKKDIITAVQSIEPSVEGVIVRVGGKDAQTKDAIDQKLFLEIDEPLIDVMKQVYEKETENMVGWTFDKYFNQVIQSHCQEHMAIINKNWCPKKE